MVKEDTLMRSCGCSGKYTLKIDNFSNPLVMNYEKIIENLQRLAHERNMRLLNDMLATLRT